MEYLRTVWEQPDSGIWEEREKPRHFIYSKIMAWVALDRAIKSIAKQSLDGPMEQWKIVRQKIHDDVCRKGFNRKMNSFVAYYSSKKVDASLLLPLVGFLLATDPRILGTIRAIENRLMTSGLLKRNRPSRKASRQGAFLACSFWLVQVLSLVGRKRDAEKLFKKPLRLSNDVGLLSEEYDTRSRELRGNFP